MSQRGLQRLCAYCYAQGVPHGSGPRFGAAVALYRRHRSLANRLASMSLPELLLEARGIGRRKAGGHEWLLREINLNIRSQDRMALTGPSGGGKTLLLRALAMLDPLDEGQICWRGRALRPAEVPDYRRQVMYVHQRPALFEGSVRENLRKPFALRSHRTSQFDEARVKSWLAELGRDAAFLDRSVRDLSGGEAQLVALLRALQLDPAVLLLDEPTAALDLEAARRVERLVARWHAETQASRAFVWVCHNLPQARRMAERTMILTEGTLREERCQ